MRARASVTESTWTPPPWPPIAGGAGRRQEVLDQQPHLVALQPEARRHLPLQLLQGGAHRGGLLAGEIPAEVGGEQRPQAGEMLGGGRLVGPGGEPLAGALGGAHGGADQRARNPAPPGVRLVAPHPLLAVLRGVVLLADGLQTLADRQGVGALAQHLLEAQLGGVAQPPGAERGEGEAEIDPAASPRLRGRAGVWAASGRVDHRVEPAVGRHRLPLAQQLEQGAGAAAGRREAAALPHSREGDAQAVEVAAQGEAVGVEIARHHADPLRPRAAVEQRADLGGDLPRLGLGPHGLAGRRGAGRLPPRRRRRLDSGGMPEALGEAGGELRFGALSLGLGRMVQDHPGAAAAQEGLDQVGGDPGGVGEAMDEDRPAPAGPRRRAVSTSSAARRRRVEARPRPRVRIAASARAAERTRARARSTSALLASERAVARQGLLDGLGVDRLESGVEQVAHGAGDRREAVGQILQPPPERRLGAGGPLGEDVEQAAAAGRGLPRALQDLRGQAEQGLHRDAGHRPPPPPHDRRRHVEAQAARGDDDPHRHLEQRGVPPHLGEKRVEALHQRRLGGAGAGRDQDAAGGAEGGLEDVEEAELLR